MENFPIFLKLLENKKFPKDQDTFEHARICPLEPCFNFL